MKMFYKKVLLKISKYLLENTCVGVFLIELQAFPSVTLLKGDINTSVFLWLLKMTLFTDHDRGVGEWAALIALACS